MYLKITKIVKKYGDSKVLDDVSLSINSKSIFGLLGPNGAGKTSLIRILSGLSNPDRGMIEVGDSDFGSHLKESKRMVGLVPQIRNLDIESTVYQNLFFHGKLYGISRVELKLEINRLLDKFGLESNKNTLIKKLSGGTQQKVLIMRSIVTKPKLLIMDEPCVGLDPQSRLSLWEIINDLKKEHTILLATQDLNEADILSDKIGILNKGTLIFEGTPSQFKDGSNNSLTNIFIEVQLLNNDKNAVINELKQLIENGILLSYESSDCMIKIKSSKAFINDVLSPILQYKVADLKVYAPTLEEVFVNLT